MCLILLQPYYGFNLDILPYLDSNFDLELLLDLILSPISYELWQKSNCIGSFWNNLIIVC